jgi:hypothetical protein
VLGFLFRRGLLSALGGEFMEPGVVHGICGCASLAGLLSQLSIPSVLRVRIQRTEDVALSRTLWTDGIFQHADARRWTIRSECDCDGC